VKTDDLEAAGVDRVPKTVAVSDGLPVLEDGRVLDVANVIWCTGFRQDFGWIDVPVFGEQEELRHERGVTSEPGLYFVGLDFLYSFTSENVGGVGRDARYIAKRSHAASPRPGVGLDSYRGGLPSCGVENRDEARFCDACGAALAAEPAREARKTVTVLFCDVTGSTQLGEQLDPESLRRVMARYFEVAKDVIERHGGAVEKFIGDAVMAVFGVPAVHEDDALRAVRAAAELRDALGGLNAELAESYGTRLELRTGVNTGEVVTGTEERLATGDAVNVAARLEQAAQPGEVLLGNETLRLVRDAVEVEPVPALELKGKADPVPAFRLLRVTAGEPEARRQTVAMVGRDRQRQLLDDAFANVAGERSCHLFTILGTAGVGKSRLVAEFLQSLDGATVVGGRCLSYGEGISYWPVTAAVKELLGPSPDDELAQLGFDPTTAQTLEPILGRQKLASSPEEISWAVRKLFEAAAARRPLVIVFDDLHWGEPVFLDLVEHIADFSRDAPILLLCMARPELLDRRSAWGGGKLNATNVLLEPLSPDEADELIERLLSGTQLDSSLRERILEAAGGNPFFVGEMLTMLAERTDGNRSAVIAGSADNPGAARVASRPTRGRRAKRAGAGRRRRPGVPPRSRGRAGARRRAGGRPADDARPQGSRSARAVAPGGRRRIPVPPPADPRRRL
jgi:class 3 adenylate cyclase